VEHAFGKRLVLGHLSIVAVILLSTAAALIALGSTIRQTERTSEIDQRLARIEKLRSDVRELARSARRYLLTGERTEQQRVLAIEGEMNKERSRSHGSAFDDQLDAYVSTVVRAMADERRDPGAALASFEDDLMRVRGPLSTLFDEIVARERGQLDASRSSQRLARTAQWALLIAAALGVLLTIGSTLVVARALRRQSERVRGAEAVAERAATSRKELLAASTELRVPLDRIAVQATELRDGLQNDERSRVLQSIANDASRVERLLRQLLDVTAVQAGTVSLRREPCDAATLVEQALDSHRETAHARGIRLRFEASLSLTVSADRERIGDALRSLVGLAITSARIGAEIEVSAVPADDGVRFAIVDIGVTVPTPSIFQPAVVAAPNDLALHLSQRVIESHGGRMGVEATTAGHTYWFTLPTEPRMLR
jgi:signal transduction histidine kinase